MSEIYNIYCDESCHLPQDDSEVMVLGALSCPERKKAEVYNDIRKIKMKHEINSKIEVKWTKVSSSKCDMFEELIDYFFKNRDLRFRAIIAQGKHSLDHKKYNNDDYDLWYYKMYYFLLEKMCYPQDQYKIFIDMKDTNGGPRIQKLHEVLCSNKYDFKKDIILDIQQINSNRADLLQLVDILIGALSFYHRGLYHDSKKSESKKRLVSKVISYTGDSIASGTRLANQKFNLFIWTPRGGDKV